MSNSGLFKPQLKIRVLILIVLVAGLSASMYLYINPPAVAEGLKVQEESADNAWMVSALITISAILILYSVHVLKSSKSN